VRRIDYLNDPDAPKANSIVVATSVYVEDSDRRILLIHRTDNDLWAMPGGGMEVGETVTECAVRETKEETGIDVEITNLVGIFTNPAHVVAYRNGEVRQQFSICLRARVAGGEVRTSDESSEVRWVHRNELAELDIHPDTRRRIDRAMVDDQLAYVD
jgi:ADP-ribose pyrophosphatase YjhB (NUDIX family)